VITPSPAFLVRPVLLRELLVEWDLVSSRSWRTTEPVSECREPEALGLEGKRDKAEYILPVEARRGGLGLEVEADLGAVVGAVRRDRSSGSAVSLACSASKRSSGSDDERGRCSYDDREGAESSEMRRGGALW
jgi:hypothetical protein